jgi:hypothetical protein
MPKPCYSYAGYDQSTRRPERSHAANQYTGGGLVTGPPGRCPGLFITGPPRISGHEAVPLTLASGTEWLIRRDTSPHPGMAVRTHGAAHADRHAR